MGRSYYSPKFQTGFAQQSSNSGRRIWSKRFTPPTPLPKPSPAASPGMHRSWRNLFWMLDRCKCFWKLLVCPLFCGGCCTSHIPDLSALFWFLPIYISDELLHPETWGALEPGGLSPLYCEAFTPNFIPSEHTAFQGEVETDRWLPPALHRPSTQHVYPKHCLDGPYTLSLFPFSLTLALSI